MIRNIYRRVTIALSIVAFVATSINMALAQASGTWTSTGTLNFPRAGETATLLANGQVLVVGGEDASGNRIAAAELYNPATGNWTVTGSLVAPRTGHTATLLTNGEVLIAGGTVGGSVLSPVITASAEVYNPSTGQFSTINSMTQSRTGAAAALLTNGEVLMASGDTEVVGGALIDTAELYNPSTGQWTATTNLPLNVGKPATVLTNGEVLVSGGSHTAELYNPSTARWSSTGSIANPGSGPAVLIPNGKVLMVGATPAHLASYSAKFYDPSTNTWTIGSAGVAEGIPVLLATGKVLVVGTRSAYAPTTACSIYDPSTNSWKATGSQLQGTSQAAVLLPNGKVLSVGSSDAELFAP